MFLYIVFFYNRFKSFLTFKVRKLFLSSTILHKLHYMVLLSRKTCCIFILLCNYFIYLDLNTEDKPKQFILRKEVEFLSLIDELTLI